MNNIEKRVEKLEQHTRATESQGPPIVYVLRDGQREPSPEEKERAMKEYVQKYGAVTAELAIIVRNEEAKNMLERLMAG